MKLQIQDPKSKNAPTLHESILEACQGAINGGGAFAFVTKEGAELLLKDDYFKPLASTGTFYLLVGVDEITNVKALQTLSKLSEEFPGLTVKVFYHELGGTIFHPKFCWFRHKSGGILITGSGNLTARGLRGNWEAFTVSYLKPKEITEIEQIWSTWIDFHAKHLKSTTDEDVLKRAAKNIFKFVSKGKKGKKTRVENVDTIEPQQLESAVLIAEIPRASTRWSQANFHKNNFINYFGMQIGNTQLRAVLQHVDDNGELGAIESRQGVSVKSRNFRLELQAATGLQYPSNGRPIAVFVCVASRTFRYMLLMPNNPHYATILSFLVSKWTGSITLAKQIVTNTEELKQVWPNSPLWINA